MGFTIEAGIPALTVFLQGIFSFFSPCVLPLVPLYISYLAGGGRHTDENGVVSYPRRTVFINTLFFVLGTSFAFFLLGFGFTALGMFFQNNRIWFARISGIIMILFGFYQLGLLGQPFALAVEHRLPFQVSRWAMGPFTALLLGFTFSFAWTPCVGPALGSVLLMAGSAGNAQKAAWLIGVYTLGFTLPFLAVGIFTRTLLELFRKHQNVIKYTVKLGAVLLIAMGIMTLTGFMNGMTSYLSKFGASTPESASWESGASDVSEPESPSDDFGADPASDDPASKSASEDSAAESGTNHESAPKSSEDPASDKTQPEDDALAVPAPGFTLSDQYGTSHSLSDYQGKTVFLNFWATWCPPCKAEMPEIQKLYEAYGNNEKDLIVMGVAAPGYGQEGSIADITSFLEENGYTFPVVMDETGALFNQYGIRAFPTTFMIDSSGNVFGYVQGAITGEIMESIVQQTMEGRRSY